jgi:hypothetical protein
MYRLTSHAMIVRLSDGVFIPPDPANTDYALYLEWLKGGNIPESFDEDTDEGASRPVRRPQRFTP